MLDILHVHNYVKNSFPALWSEVKVYVHFNFPYTLFPKTKLISPYILLFSHPTSVLDATVDGLFTSATVHSHDE